jgi:hypothetical protein
MVLRYLVTGCVRRALLRALWVKRAQGSVSALARQTRSSFAAAHRELEAMRAAGLALCERLGNRVVYRANHDHPLAPALRALLAPPARERATPDERPDDAVRGWLRDAGAPLGAAAVRGKRPPLEEVLASALELAHRDATVARVLPLVLWLQRRHLDHETLARAATRRNERQALGCFLELAGRLGDDAALVRRSQGLRDRRRSHPQPFFTRSTGRMAAASAQRNTPAAVRKWGFLMNLGLDSFASAFTRHRGRAAA